MGLLKELALLPVAPLRLTTWVVEQVHEEAQRREAGPAAVVQRIDEIDELRRQGRIDQAEADRRQSEALERVVGPPASGDGGGAPP